MCITHIYTKSTRLIANSFASFPLAILPRRSRPRVRESLYTFSVRWNHFLPFMHRLIQHLDLFIFTRRSPFRSALVCFVGRHVSAPSLFFSQFSVFFQLSSLPIPFSFSQNSAPLSVSFLHLFHRHPPPLPPSQRLYTMAPMNPRDTRHIA